MGIKPMNIQDKLLKARLRNGLLEVEWCTKAENEEYETLKRQNQDLPHDVKYSYDQERFYRVRELNYTDKDLKELCMLRQTEYLHSIRNTLTLFVIVFIIAFIILCNTIS